MLAVVAFAGGGAVAGLLFLSGLIAYGPSVICAGNLLCDKAGYFNVGAARGVHLVGTADPYTGFSVVWESPGRQRPPRVEYRRLGDTDWSVAEGVSQPAAANGLVGSSSFVHRVRVNGLEPGRSYQYRVSWDPRSSTREFSPTFTTRTASPGQSLKLAFLSDICLGDRPDGRSGPIGTVMTQVLDDDIDLILGGGDYACVVDDGRYVTAEPAIQRFFDEWQPVFSSIPFIAQYGNHECCHGEKAALWDTRFDLWWAPEHTRDGRSFAFDLLDTHIVGFYGTGAETAAAPDHLQWLDQTLADARAQGQRHLLVFEHGPIFGTGRTHPPQPEFRRQVVPVLERHHVDLHVSAHDMSYERTFPLTDGADGTPTIGSREPAAYQTWTGVVYAKVSPTGRPTSVADNVPDDLPPYLAVADDEHYFYAVITVALDKPLEVVVYALDRTGKRRVVDEFTLDGGARHDSPQ